MSSSSSGCAARTAACICASTAVRRAGVGGSAGKTARPRDVRHGAVAARHARGRRCAVRRRVARRHAGRGATGRGGVDAEAVLTHCVAAAAGLIDAAPRGVAPSGKAHPTTQATNAHPGRPWPLHMRNNHACPSGQSSFAWQPGAPVVVSGAELVCVSGPQPAKRGAQDVEPSGGTRSGRVRPANPLLPRGLARWRCTRGPSKRRVLVRRDPGSACSVG